MSKLNNTGLEIGILLTFLGLCLFSIAGWTVIKSYDSSQILQQRFSAEKKLEVKAKALEQIVDQRISLLYGARAFILSNLNHFDDIHKQEDRRIANMFLEELSKAASDIRMIMISPEGIHQYVYPEEAYNKTVGHNLLTDPRPHVRQKVQETINSGTIGLSGPYSLRQDGSLGLIARLPVYIDNRFWGFVTMVLDVPQLLKTVDIDQTSSFALRKQGQEPFWGRSQTFQENSIVTSVALADGTWEFGTEAGVTGLSLNVKIVLHSLNIFFALLASGLFFSLYSRRYYLQQAVDKATSQLVTQGDSLRESLARYQSLFENNHSIILLIDPETRAIYDANPAACKFYGYSKEDLLNLSISDINILPEQQLIKDIAVAQAGGMQSFFFTHRLADGTTRDVVSHSGSMKINGKDLLCSIIQDETERRTAEMALYESEQKYRLLADHTYDWEFWLNPEGEYLYISPACERISGYHSSEFIKDPNLMLRLVTASYAEEVHQHYNDPDLQNAMFYSMEFAITSKDGEERWIEHSCRPVFDDSGHYLGRRGTNRDITDRIKAQKQQQQLEEQLRQTQKMEAIGNLAGGIAHDFNNILAAIFGYTELAMREENCDGRVKRKLESVLAASGRAKSLVRQILMYSRKREDNYQFIELHTIVLEACNLLRKTIPSSIPLQLDIDESTGVIQADATQIHQIVMNLCTNAYHALPEQKGTISISLKPIIVGSELALKYPDLQPNTYALLTVADTGSGMSEEIEARIFDPFFTTKKTGTGTGIGLSVVHRIVQEHHGSIKVDSCLGKGTIFEVLFPLVTEKASENIQEIVTSVEISGNEHILFVDDEAMLVELGQTMLNSYGYQVTGTLFPLQALELFKADPNAYDIIITDQTMPEMTGDLLAQKVMQIRTDIPVIVCTGNSATLDSEKAETIGIKKIFQKPLDVHILLKEVRQILDKDTKKAERTIPVKHLKIKNAESDIEPLKKDFLLLPPELRRDLKIAVNSLNPDEIDVVSTNIKQGNHRLGVAIQSLAADFRFDQIKALFES